MPETDGYATLELINRNLSLDRLKSLIVACTAQGDEEIEKIESSGFDDIITKPLSKSSLNHFFEKWFI